MLAAAASLAAVAPGLSVCTTFCPSAAVLCLNLSTPPQPHASLLGSQSLPSSSTMYKQGGDSLLRALGPGQYCRRRGREGSRVGGRSGGWGGSEGGRSTGLQVGKWEKSQCTSKFCQSFVFLSLETESSSPLSVIVSSRANKVIPR